MALQDYLIKSDRINSTQKSITLVDPSRIDAFLDEVKLTDMPLEFKLYLALTHSGGLRRGEAFSLQLKHIDWKNEKLVGVKVLKKRLWDPKKQTIEKPITRMVDLDPVALDLLKEHIDTLKDKKLYNKIFSFSTTTIHNYCKKYLDKDFSSHSARHAHISFWLHKACKTPQWIAKFMKMRPETVAIYSHINSEPPKSHPFRKSYGKQ